MRIFILCAVFLRERICHEGDARKMQPSLSDRPGTWSDYRILGDIGFLCPALMNVVSLHQRLSGGGPRLTNMSRFFEIIFDPIFSDDRGPAGSALSDRPEELGKNASPLHSTVWIRPNFLGRRIELARSCIFFLGNPASHPLLLGDPLSADRQPYAVYADSVFKEEQHGLVIAARRLKPLSAAQSCYLPARVTISERISHARQGNYMVFSPPIVSWRMSMGNFCCLVRKSEVLVQEREMSEKIESFLGQLQRSASQLFWPLRDGGSFSEGIDLLRQS